MQAFLVLLMGVTAVLATPRPAFCPQATPIYPCICSTELIEGRLHVNLDCSEVTSNYVLESVFQEGNFLYTKFSKLTINPPVRHPALTALNPTVFGDVSFEHILINHTYIRTINEEAFAPSHDTLLHLILSNNMINAFPFETLSVFAHLRFLNLANNKLLYLPNIESNSLYQVDLSGNTGGLTFTSDTFKNAPSLEEIDLNNMGLTSFPPNVFSNLNSLRIIDLSKNNLKGVFGEDVIRVPLDSVEDLRLNGNAITDIHPTAITGKHHKGNITHHTSHITHHTVKNIYSKSM